MKPAKFYVVWKGRQTGIFTSWEACSAQVAGFTGAEYKSFASRAEAELAFQSPGRASLFMNSKTQAVQLPALALDSPILDSYSVDAACSGNPGRLEYRCVHNRTRQEIFHQGPFSDGTNNVGEFLAIVHALALFTRRKVNDPVYSDSETAIGWVKKKHSKTRMAHNDSNAELFHLIERAEKWLAENAYSNRILKWDTEAWGEIPADYGRK